MNIKSLNQGQEFKNLKELCTCLGIEYKDSTNSRKNIIKEIERYVKLTKKGRKILIDEIYHNPKDKVDNRKGNSGTSIGSRGNYKGIYAEDIDFLLIQYLTAEFYKLKGTCKIYATNNKIAEGTGIVNCNYRTAFNNREKFYNTVKKDFDIKVNTYCMFDVFDMTKTKIREIVKGSLDRLVKQELLEYETCYFVYIPYVARPPVEEEMKVIAEAEESTMKEMGVEEKKQIDNNYKLSNKFNKKVLEKVQEKFDYIESIYKGYTISLWDDFELAEPTKIQEKMKELNDLVINALREKPPKIQEKAMEGKEYSVLWGGLRNPFWEPWIFDRCSKKYIDHCYDFINILVNIEANNITDKIKNCKNNKIKHLTKEQKEEYTNKVSDKLIDNFKLDDKELDKQADKDMAKLLENLPY